MATVRTGAAFAFLAAFAMSAYAEPIANQSRSQMKLAQDKDKDKDKDAFAPNALPAARCKQDCDNAAEIAVPKWSAAALVGCKARC